MSKGICPSCHKNIVVDLGKNVEACVHCQKEYLPRQAHKLFELLYSQYSSNGNIALNVSRNYAKALDEYQKLLAIDEDSVDAIFGVANATISLSKIDEDGIDRIIVFLESKIDKMLANSELFAEIARNLMLLASRFDMYINQSKKVLTVDDKFIDEGAKSRYLKIINNGLAFWEFVSKIFDNNFDDYVDEISIIKTRVQNLHDQEKLLADAKIRLLGDNQYILLKDNAIFESRLGLFKWRLVLAVLQIVFVIGAIIGFSIMMANYSNNPFPGLIVFGVFALLFVVANVAGRILKNKLAK